jgi:hypothetical protein
MSYLSASLIIAHPVITEMAARPSKILNGRLMANSHIVATNRLMMTQDKIPAAK